MGCCCGIGGRTIYRGEGQAFTVVDICHVRSCAYLVFLLYLITVIGFDEWDGLRIDIELQVNVV